MKRTGPLERVGKGVAQALTVGDLRRLLADTPDGQPLRVEVTTDDRITRSTTSADVVGVVARSWEAIIRVELDLP